MRFLILVLLWVNTTVFAADALTNQLNTYLRKVSPRVTVGIEVKSLATGRVLYARNADQPLVPASNLKIITAVAALLYLGPNYAYKTRLYISPVKPVNGVFKGNIYFQYSGDPTLKSEQINALIGQLKKYGIKTVEGNVYVDDRAYDQNNTAKGWSHNDLSRCYSAPINAIIINHNCMLSSAGFTMSVSHVFSYSQMVLSSALKHSGIRLKGGRILRGAVDKSAKMIGYHYSAPLSKLVSTMLKKSDNIISASLFKKMGEVYSKQQGSWQTGSLAVKDILRRRYAINLDRAILIDGSGLSHNDRVTAANFVNILERVYKTFPVSNIFYKALPISGVDGTLHTRMYPIAGRVHAKTGTVDGVSSLSGYVKTRRQGIYVFSIVINGFAGKSPTTYRKLEDRIVSYLATL